MTDYPRPTFDTTRPHSARVRNYLLGGKDNFPVDREYADELISVFPEIVDVARASRGFLSRAVTYLAAEAGVRQFLDVGPGLPVEYNTHQIAQRVAPESRVVYVDNDAMVLVHARALLVGTPEGAVACLDADAHDPDKILKLAADTLDLTRPVALVLTAVMGLIADLDEAHAITRTLLAGLPSGSYLVLDDGTVDQEPDEAILRMRELTHGYHYQYRTKPEVVAFFDGLELVEPGIVSPSSWRNDLDPNGPVAPFESCGVGRKR